MRILREEIEYIKIIEMKNRNLTKKEILERVEISPELKDFLEKHRWIEIPNKNLWFNSEIMGCYPNFNINFQNLYFDHVPSYEEALNTLKNNEEYCKYRIKWDLQTYIEGQKSFGKTHPMETHSRNHMIHGQDAFLCISNAAVIAYYNSEEPRQTDHGLLIPIYRILPPKYYENLESTGAVFNCSALNIVKLLITRGLKPQMSEELNDEYNWIFKYVRTKLKYASEIGEIQRLAGDKAELKFLELLEKGKREILKNSRIEFGLKNGDKVELSFEDSYSAGDGKHFYSNGDIEECRFEIDSDGNYIKIGIGKVLTEKGKKYYQYGDGKRKEVTTAYTILAADSERTSLPIYDTALFTDPNKGDWDIFDDPEIIESIEKEMGEKVYGRDPHLDIKKGGIVAIDFGSKSTVVVFQHEGMEKLPMRISGGKSKRGVYKRPGAEYENPTAIEFNDINSFMKAYIKREGRPFTKWRDIAVCYGAVHTDREISIDTYENIERNGGLENFYSTIYTLKEWVGNKSENSVIKDKKGAQITLPPYFKLKDGEFDPVEIYAYYIGSYINNMENGVYTEYYLSFPVSYEGGIRDRIVESFRRGIRKSLPQVLIDDEEFISQFKVSYGTSESASYAVCALQEYGFEPEEDERIYYGIFDFGGGTTDFDFGIWKKSDDIEKYDYELQHFGARYHEFLGGENILKEMAYEVFKDNMEILKDRGISFYRPYWCKRFEGHEMVLDTTSQAKFNILILMEKLRPMWELESVNQQESVRIIPMKESCLINKSYSLKKQKDTGETLTLSLYGNDGEVKDGIELKIDRAAIEEKISSRIDEGIKNFFISLENAMENEEVDKINLFLAGNSCNYPQVMEKFRKAVEKSELSIEIFPPLGSEECMQKLEERGVSRKTGATGKTGVAYGILDTVEGRRIKVRNLDREANVGEKENFRFYVGNEKDGRLSVILSPHTAYETYVRLGECRSDIYNIFYTSLPEGISDMLEIERTKLIRLKLRETYPGASLYIKSVDTGKIAYAVTRDKIERKNYLEDGEIELE